MNETGNENLINENIKVEIINNSKIITNTDYEKSLFEISSKLDMLSSHADKLDYFIAVASGLLCGMMDVLWTGNFDLYRGRGAATEKVNDLVVKISQMCGNKSDDIKDSVAYLEKMFPIPEDGNTPDFGGGLQHHLRDFGHHPTIVGLIFSLLTQFTKCSYGTDKEGVFIVVPVPEKSRIFIGKNIPDKIFRGTVIWFFHLVSDIAGSSGTVDMSGGTGIPGPVLSLAKEISATRLFRNAKVQDYDLPLFLSKLFNGSLFAKRDGSGKIIKETVLKFDFRGELGVLEEMGRQAIPVIANDVVVRSFYFIRRLIVELKQLEVNSINDIKWVDWNKCVPFDNPTVDRMLTIASGVFSSMDFAGAVATQTYWVSINYVGIGRFTVAVGKEMVWLLRARKLKKIKAMYERIRQNTFDDTDNRIYGRIGEGMDYEKFGLTLEQTEILYNIEFFKALNDISKTVIPLGGERIVQLKNEWVNEWRDGMEKGFRGFTGRPDAVLHWYNKKELLERIAANNPTQVWFRLVLLEAMLFKPYYPLSLEEDRKGNKIPSRKYRELQNPVAGYKKAEGDKFFESFFDGPYYRPGYVRRLRRCYDKVLKELNEVLKMALTALGITAVVTVAAVVTAGMLAGPIAVALVGSNFAGLSGAALTSACLAYIGGGAIAAGGAGILGGTVTIVGGGALLGVGVGAGVGGAVGAAGLMGKKGTILQSAKLMVSVREIFLNDEHDIAYSNAVYEQFVRNIADMEKGLVELKLKENTADKEEKKRLQQKIKNTEESVKAMKIAMKSMNRYISAFEVGAQEKDDLK